MDKILLNNMQFYGYHGVFSEENRLGQRFNVDVALGADLKEAGRTDEIEASIDYGQVYQVTKEVVEGKAYNLIESVAEKIAERLLETFPSLENCNIKVTKPDPPIPGHYDSAAVEIYRERD